MVFYQNPRESVVGYTADWCPFQVRMQKHGTKLILASRSNRNAGCPHPGRACSATRQPYSFPHCGVHDPSALVIAHTRPDRRRRIKHRHRVFSLFVEPIPAKFLEGASCVATWLFTFDSTSSAQPARNLFTRTSKEPYSSDLEDVRFALLAGLLALLCSRSGFLRFAGRIPNT